MSHSDSHVDPAAAAKSVEAGIELTDVNPQSLVVFAISLFVALIVVIGASGLVFEIMKNHHDEASEAAMQNVLGGANDVAPLGADLQPSQANPQEDWQELAAMKAENDRIENSLSETAVPMNDGHAHAHIPVDWAIKLLVKNGIPQNTATDIPVPVGTAVSGPTEYSPAYQSDGRDAVTH